MFLLVLRACAQHMGEWCSIRQREKLLLQSLRMGGVLSFFSLAFAQGSSLAHAQG